MAPGGNGRKGIEIERDFVAGVNDQAIAEQVVAHRDRRRRRVTARHNAVHVDICGQRAGEPVIGVMPMPPAIRQ